MTSYPYDTVHKALWLAEMQPGTILDIGVGFGTFGVIVRERLECTTTHYMPKDWVVDLEGVEIWKPYIDEFKHLDFIYTKIHNADIYDWIQLSENKDRKWALIHAGDVIEHLPKDKALAVLEWIRGHCKNFILSIPIGYIDFTYQHLKNPAEKHLSAWQAEELGKDWYKGIGNKGNAGIVNTLWWRYDEKLTGSSGRDD